MSKFGLDFLQRLRGRGRGSPEPSRIVVGLGNPGARYARTRHNIGFWCIDRLAREHSIALSGRSRACLFGEGLIAGRPVVLAKPRTYVNLSGEAVAYLLARYRASPSTLLVVHDDMDLPVGKLRLRARGGSGGHNGLKSIVEAVHTQEFARLRTGIGRPQPGTDPVEHVLSAHSPDEGPLIEEAIARAAEVVSAIIADGIESAMDRFN